MLNWAYACRTTLHWAALGSAVEAWPSLVGARFGSNVESAQLLLDAKAEVKTRDDAGCTPMHYAAGETSLAFLVIVSVMVPIEVLHNCLG